LVNWNFSTCKTLKNKIMKTIKKIFALVLLFTITSFALEVKAQTINYTWENQSGCDWVIQVTDAGGTPTVAGGASANALSGPATVPTSGCISPPSGSNFTFKNLGCGCEVFAPVGASSTTINVTADCLTQGCDPVYCTTSPTTTLITVVKSPGLTCNDEYTITIQ
jgi:hypothetical protein